MTKENLYSILIVYNNLEIINTISEDNCKERPILIFIKTEFYAYSSSKLKKYYQHQIYDHNLAIISSNTFFYNNIKCILEPKENWRTVFSNHRSVAIKAEITDGENNTRTFNFPNNGFKGEGFYKLMDYLKVLNSKIRHEDAEVDLKLIVRPK